MHRPPTFTEERKQEVLAAIKAHLAESGAKNYKPLLTACADIPSQTLWRWIRCVKREPPTDRDIRQANDALIERAAAAAAGIEPPPVTVDAADLGLPPPGIVAKIGVKRAMRKLDFANEIEKLYSDAEMLRAFSVKEFTDADGELAEKIKNPLTFEKSIKSRVTLIETALKVLGELWNARTVQQFHAIIVEEIGRVDMDTQKRIIERLRVVNERHGMTLSMRL